MADKTKLILRNDARKRRQQLNFSISRDLHLDIKDLHIIFQRKNKVKTNLKDFYELVISKGVKEWLNR